MNFERRLVVSGVQLRKAAPGSKSPGTISGYAATFGTFSKDLGGFREMLKRGCFTRTLKSKPDVKCLQNHDPNFVLGRATNGTLRLEQDDQGLKFSCDLPNTTYARDLYTSISRGDLSECSFAFKVVPNGDSWGTDSDKNGEFVSRTVTDCDLFDVSAVTCPAYDSTSVSTDDINPTNIDAIRVSQSALVEARSRSGRRAIYIPHVSTVAELRERMERITHEIQLSDRVIAKRTREANRNRNHGRLPVGR